MADLDRIIHEPSRLRIVTYLACSEKKEVSFSRLQEELEFTSGNLSVQLKRLSDAGYVNIQKSFRDNKPHTAVSLTRDGLKSLEAYLKEMEDIIQSIKK